MCGLSDVSGFADPFWMNLSLEIGTPTVDGRNPVPPGMYKTLSIMG